MKLSVKIFLAFLIVSVLPITLITLWGYSNSRSFFREQYMHTLEDFADAIEIKLNNVVQPEYENFIQLSSNPEFVVLVQQHLNENTLKSTQEVSDFVTNVIDSFDSVLILDNEKTPILEIDINQDGANKIDIMDSHSISEKDSDISLVEHFEEDSNNYYIQFSAPLIYNDTLIGRIIAKKPAFHIQSIINSSNHLGESGEIVLVRKTDEDQIKFLTHFKFDSTHKTQLFPEEANDLLPAKIVFDKKDTSLSDAVDYRNEPVFAVTRYLHLPNWGLIVKIDQSEALDVASDFLTSGIIINFGVLVLFLLVSTYLTQSWLRPIKAMVSTAEKLATGDYSARVHVNSNDEFRILQKTFNLVAENIQKQIGLTIQEKARLRSAIDALPSGFILLDTKNKVELFNTSITHILGLKDKRVTLEILNTELNTQIDIAKIYNSLYSSNKSFEMVQTESKNGKILRIFIVPVIADAQGSKTIGTIILIQDITQEAKLSESKDEFLAVASHELKTPLTSIRGNISLLKQYFINESTEKQVIDITDEIESSSDRLIHLVNDFLNASRLEQGKLSYSMESFDLMEVIHLIVEELKVITKERKNKVVVHQPDLDTVSVEADKSKTRQILTNLINNSNKFTTQGTITITVTLEEKFAVCQISDTGKGIERKNQHKLFTKFSQTGDSVLTRDASQGSGLGLYISKKLIEAMNGSIRLVSSEVNKGTTFEVKIPRSQT